MNAIQELRKRASEQQLQLATFTLGPLLLGVDIRQVQEINRHMDFTPVPHAQECVCGVVNLRGDVVTVLDLRIILGLPAPPPDIFSRVVIVKTQTENVGMLVDRVADVLQINSNELDAVPANVQDIDSKHILGVYKLTDKLLVVLDIDSVIDSQMA